MIFPFQDKSGLTLLELLVGIVIIGMIVGGLGQLMGSTFSGYDHVKEKQKLLCMASLVMGRMAMFVQETDHISSPLAGELNKTMLTVSERVLDTYNNSTHSYILDGDNLLDADNDSDGIVNIDSTSGSDPKEYVEFKLDGNVISTRGPDYSTAATDDQTAYRTLCEHVEVFECDGLANNLVEIRLTLNDGKNEVSLKTRVKARNVN